MTTSGEPGSQAGGVDLDIGEFRLLHQITKELPNLSLEGVDESFQRHVLDLVRSARAQADGVTAVTLLTDDGREVAVRRDGARLVVDTGLGRDALALWATLGRAVVSALGSPELDLRTGGSPAQAEDLLAKLEAGAQ